MANPQPKSVQFSDLNITFAKHPVTGQLSVLKNNDALKRAVRNLILTNKYERMYKPLVGGNIRAKLFENMDQFTAFTIRKEIEQAIRNYEPRAELIEVRVDAREEENGVNVTIVYRPKNQANPISFDLFVERVR